MSVPPEPRSSRPVEPRRALRISTFGFVLVVMAVAFLSLAATVVQLLSPLSSDKKAPLVLVTIPSHSNAHEIGDILVHKHLIRSARAFEMSAKWAGLSTHLVSGHYELSPAMPPRQMAALIALGQTATDFVTIPEGFTLAKIAHRLAEKHMVDEDKFLTLARTEGKTFKVEGFQPPNDNLEGYLFPDTYQIPKGTNEHDIIMIMLTNFTRRVLPLDDGVLKRDPQKLASVMTLASLVEREAEVDTDRPLIAGALSNRIKIHMPLDCDATVQYALPVYKSRLYYSDLRVDSPYNTYLHPGLPPTPIASPGLPSIEAALHPAATDALYYVARPDGSHVFSPTLAAHDRAVSEIRALRGRT